MSLKLIIDAQSRRDISKEKGKGLPKIQEWDNDENVMRWGIKKGKYLWNKFVQTKMRPKKFCFKKWF